jgi:trk system potassium uptake protein TrkA
MFVIIVGGGKTGSFLAEQLLKENHKVRLIENRPQILERLQKELSRDVLIEGDGSSPSALEIAGAREADVLAAVTGEDEANLVITTLAKFEFSVARTIARVNNPKNAWLFNDEMGVDVAVNQTDLLARLIVEEMSLGDMMVLLKLRRGEYSIVEERVHPTARVVGKAVKDVSLPPECTLVGFIRQGKLIIPKGDVIFEAFDEVIALLHTSKAAELAKILGEED